MCAGIGQVVVLSISNAWCDVGGGWNAGVGPVLMVSREWTREVCVLWLFQ